MNSLQLWQSSSNLWSKLSQLSLSWRHSPSRPGFLATRRKANGFTLLELLVVISIIGILIALGAAAFSTAQRRGRDSKRRGDMKAIQSGFEQFFAENTAYGDTCNEMAVSPYLPAGLPTDPKADQSYVSTCSATQYCICATLEGAGTGNASNTTCTYATGTGADYFCVSNLQ